MAARHVSDDGSTRRFALVAALSAFPATALLHHLIFFRSQCMLNPFGPEYTPDVIRAWLVADPSPGWAAAAALTLFRMGRERRTVRAATTWFVIAFLPVTVWLWDLPFTGRVICTRFHDGLSPLRTFHLYALGVAVWLALALHAGRARQRARRVDESPRPG